MVKKSQRKGEVEAPKKVKLSPEQEVKAIVKKSQLASAKNENKMTIEEAVRVLRVRIAMLQTLKCGLMIIRPLKFGPHGLPTIFSSRPLL